MKNLLPILNAFSVKKVADEEYLISGILQKSDSNKHAKNINFKIVNNEEDYNSLSDMNVLEDVQLPCEFCHKMINSENLVLHEVN